MPAQFLEIAARHWTREREAKLSGGRAWPLMPSEAPLLLRTMRLLNADASMSADNVRKFSQINHMVSLVLPQVEDLAARHPVLRILDVCCGTSHLSLILAWLLHERFKKPCQIIGVDRNSAVIKTSAQRALELGLQDVLRFEAATIDLAYGVTCFSRLFPENNSPEQTTTGRQPGPEQPAEPAARSNDSGPKKPPRPNLLIALHACDTASDTALALGIAAKADVMAVAPCCHAELARAWKDHTAPHPMTPIFRSPNLRRETAAQLTDALRMLLVRARGYEVTATEFVPSAHTPKNRLLLAIRRGNFLNEAQVQYQELKTHVGGHGPHLEELLQHDN